MFLVRVSYLVSMRDLTLALYAARSSWLAGNSSYGYLYPSSPYVLEVLLDPPVAKACLPAVFDSSLLSLLEAFFS